MLSQWFRNEGENVVSVVQKIPLSLFWSKVAQLNACDVFVDDQGNDGWFLFYQKFDITLGDRCGT